MNMKLYDDPNLIEYRTDVEGWIGGGKYLGKDESIARDMICTHKYCKDCGQPVLKYHLFCKTCQTKRNNEKYKTFKSQPWKDEDTPIAIYNTDTYFYNWDEVYEYCEEFNIDIKDLQLVHCKGGIFNTIEEEQIFDVGLDDEVDISSYKKILDAMGALNDAIIETGNVVFYPTNIRVKV